MVDENKFAKITTTSDSKIGASTSINKAWTSGTGRTMYFSKSSNQFFPGNQKGSPSPNMAMKTNVSSSLPKLKSSGSFAENPRKKCDQHEEHDFPKNKSRSIFQTNLSSSNLKFLKVWKPGEAADIAQEHGRLAIEKSYPDLLRSDYIYSQYGDVAEKKELLELLKWSKGCFDWIKNETLEKESTLTLMQFCLNKIAGTLLRLIERNSTEKGKIFKMIWNESVVSFHEFIEKIVYENMDSTLSQKNINFPSDNLENEFASRIDKISLLEKELATINSQKTKLENKIKVFEDYIKDNEGVVSNAAKQNLQEKNQSALLHKTIMKSCSTQTTGLINTKNASIITDFNLQTRESVFTQTYLVDFIESVTELPLSPAKKKKSPQVALKEIMDVIENSEDKINPKNDSEVNSKSFIFSWKAEIEKQKSHYSNFVLSENEFKDFYVEGSLSIKKLFDIFQEKSKNLYVKVENLVYNYSVKKLLTPSIQEIEELGLCIEQNRKTLDDFLTVLRLRDRDNLSNIMNIKAFATDIQIEMSEHKNAANNWQNRFNQLYNKHKAQQELLIQTESERKRDAVPLTSQDILSSLNKKIAENRSFSPEPVENLIASTKEPNQESKGNKKRRATIMVPSNSSPMNLIRSRSNSKLFEFTGALMNSGGSNLITGPLSDRTSKISSKNTENGIRRAFRTITAPLTFKSNKMKIMSVVESQTSQNAIKFMRRLKTSPLQPEDIIGSDSLFRLISSIYCGVFRNETRKYSDKPFYFYLYEYILSRYGGTSVKQAESKLIEIIATGLAYENVPRARMFLKMMNVVNDPFELEPSDMNAYFDLIVELDDEKALNSSTPLGMQLLMSSDKNCSVSLRTAQDFCTKTIKAPEFSQTLLEIREPCSVTKNRFIVNVDLFIENYFLFRFNQKKLLYYSVFAAVDYNSENSIDYEAFFLSSQIEPFLKANEHECKKLFEQEADLVDSESQIKYLSLKRFFDLANKTGYFSEASQNNFLQNRINDIENIKELKDVWDLKKNLIKIKYIYANSYTPLLKQLLESLDGYFKSENVLNSDEKTSWMRYRILDSDSQNKYLEKKINEFIPADFENIRLSLRRLL